MKLRNIPSPIREVIFALNGTAVRLTPGFIIRKFVSGQYLDFKTRNEHRPGYLPWKVTKFFLDRALRDGELFISHQDLNAYPLAETFLQEYKALGGRHSIPSTNIAVHITYPDGKDESYTETFYTPEGVQAHLHILYDSYVFYYAESEPCEVKYSDKTDTGLTVEYLNGARYSWNIEPEAAQI